MATIARKKPREQRQGDAAAKGYQSYTPTSARIARTGT